MKNDIENKSEDLINALKNFGFECCEHSKYSSAGITFCQTSGPYKGIFWMYETEDFVISIQNLLIVEDLIMPLSDYLRTQIEIYSNYIINGNGECLAPYQNITSNSLLIVDTHDTKLRFSLHGNSPYVSVGICFKKNMLQDITDRAEITHEDTVNIFFTTRKDATQKIKPLANEIINYQGEGIAAELFFEAKAREWLSVVLNEYDKKNKKKAISLEDDNSLESVEKYISDHFTKDISQDFLEEIAMMSKTKLKNLFKQKYNMNITEYIQRKRINMGEYLILTTDMLIADVAKAVGYSCSGRFTDLFKRYKGICPKDVRKFKN